MTDGQEDKENNVGEQTQEEVFVSGDEAHDDSWQDELPPESDLPPEDDFHDVGSVDEQDGETDLTGDEESYVEEPSSEGVAEGEVGAIDKTRGKKVLVGALVVGVVFIGGLAYLQFGGSSKSTNSLPIAQVVNLKSGPEKPDAAPRLPSNQATSATAPSNGPTDMASLYVGTAPQGVAMPLSSSKDGAGENGDKAALGNSSDMMTLDGPVGAAAAPAPVPAKAETAPATKPAMAEAAPALPPVPDGAALPSSSNALRPVPAALPAVAPLPSSSAATDARMKALNDQIDALKKALDQTMQQNAELMKRIDSMQNDQTAANEKAALEGRVKQLEQQLASQAASAPVAVASAPKASVAVKAAPAHRSELDMLADSSITESSGPEQEGRASSAPVSSGRKKTYSTSSSKRKSRNARKGSSRSSVAGSGWVLRAATPDTAWVSMGPEAQELRRVTVGETLSGIGKVKEIRQDGESWTLVGTKGSVH